MSGRSVSGVACVGGRVMVAGGRLAVRQRLLNVVKVA